MSLALELFLRYWKLLALGVLLSASYIKGCSDEKTRHDETKATYAAIGRAQEEWTKLRTSEDRKRKEQADADQKRSLDDLRARIERLRRERADSSFVPPASPGARDAGRAAFDRAELERALRSLDSGVQRLVDEGSEAVTKLDGARRWAQQP